MASTHHPKPSRDEMEAHGATFHRGFVQDANFVFADQQTTADITDLIVSGWVLVADGIMEPPNASVKSILAAGGILLAGYLLHKLLQQ